MMTHNRIKRLLQSLKKHQRQNLTKDRGYNYEVVTEAILKR